VVPQVIGTHATGLKRCCSIESSTTSADFLAQIEAQVTT
jgi:hypothetical protein